MPKNIVLLSDGTGNSAAQLLKTNVWRVYETLKLTDPTLQVACYDDGVGTSSFKPLALAGGVLGVGLSRNVLRLYRFLCEHYDPGDRIYALGFSRGAFTIRVLIGLICDQGIIKTRPTGATVEGVSPTFRSGTTEVSGTGPVPQPDSTSSAPARVSPADAVYGSELARMSRWAYRKFRRKFNQTGVLVTVSRAFRDGVLRVWESARGRRPYDQGRNHEVREIEFVGLWDTVDAYGLPVDELTDGVDKWVWPLSMPDLRLSHKVRKACHALALDDERNTFHPVLWDESDEPQDRAQVGDERISQVWFAGMHSNVGGGYPDDALSYVSLAWVTKQGADCGLVFVQELLQHHTDKADPLGRIYDSRSGLKGYYRYNPRRIEWLTNGQVHERGLFGRRWPKPNPTVTVPRPKIHESVFARISAAPEAYAPIVMPDRYGVVMADGRILDGDANPFEKPDASGARAQAQERAWNLVWWRRIVYFATVAASLALLVRPFRDEAIRSAERGPASRAITALGEILPSMAAPWTEYFAAEPRELAIGAVALLLLMRWGRGLQASICGTMRGIWLSVTPPPGFGVADLRPPENLLYKLRSHPVYQGTFSALRRHVLPTVFGITTLLWLAGAANRAPFELANSLGLFCASGASRSLSVTTPTGQKDFNASAFCTGTGIRLEAGQRYRIDLVLGNPGDWRDERVEVPFPAGFTSRSAGLSNVQRAVFTAFVPFRRVWSAAWFTPIARINDTSSDQYILAKPSTEITARTSGELFVFVNDAILPVSLWPPSISWLSYYRNNHGAATATVTRLAGGAATPAP